MAKTGISKIWYLRIINGRRYTNGPSASPTPTITPSPTVSASTTITPTRTPTLTATSTITPTTTATRSLTPTRSPTISITPSSGSFSPGDITTFTVEGTGTEMVTFGHTFIKGQIPSSATVTVALNDNTIVNTQVEKKATHADGSLRHAVITASVTGGTSYKIRSRNNFSVTNKTINDLLTAIPGDIARINFTNGVTGSVILRDLLENTTNRAVGGLQIFEQGELMLGLVVAQNITTHLRATFHIRWYGGNLIWCDFFFENGYGNLNGQNSVSYTATCILNSTQVSQNILAPHYNHSSWHPKKNGFWSSAGTLYARLNARYLIDSMAFPNYSLTTAPTTANLNSLRQTTTPMDNGDYLDNLDDTGADGTIAMLPSFDVAYFKSQCDSRAFGSILANADGGMAYSYHILDSLTGDYMNESNYPNTSYNQGLGYGSGAFTGRAPFTPQGSSVGSHTPSVGYTAYVLTGMYSMMRVMHGWTTFTNLWNSTPIRNYTYQGKVYRRASEGSIRGIAWAYRTNGQTGFITPDNHIHKLYYREWVNANAEFDTARYGPGGTLRNNIGGIFCVEGNNNYSLFFHYFHCQATAHVALDLGYTNLLEVAKYSAILPAGLAGNTGEYPFEAGPRDRRPMGPDATTFYADFAQVKAANVASNADTGSQALATFLATQDSEYSGLLNEITGRQFANDSYYANAKPCMSYLERLGINGAFACFYRYTLCTLQPDWRNAGQFDIVPREVSLPSWHKNLAVNQWYSIPNTLISSVDPVPSPPGLPRSKIIAWGGLSLKSRDSEILVVASGGHTDYAGNEVDKLTLNVENPQWEQVRAPTTTGNIVANQPYYLDDRPVSRHVYYDCQFIDGLNRAILHGATFTYQSAPSFDTVTVFDPVTNDYLPSNTYANSPGAAGIAAKCKQWSSEFIWFSTTGNNATLKRWNPKTGNTSTGFNSFNFGQIYRGAAIDPIRNRMLVSVGPEASITWQWYNLTNGTPTNVNPGSSVNATDGPALEWDVIGNRYLYFSGQALHSIDPVTFTASAISITGTPPPASTPNGIFSRMRFVPEMGGIVVVTNHNNNVFFIKLYNRRYN